MATRINVILPDTMIRTINRRVKPGERSRFIDRALQHYVATRSALGLREQLAETTIRDRDLEQEFAVDWAAVDYAPWQHTDKRKEGRGRAAARSTSRGSTQQ
jgi:hypothetical protein